MFGMEVGSRHQDVEAETPNASKGRGMESWRTGSLMERHSDSSLSGVCGEFPAENKFHCFLNVTECSLLRYLSTCRFVGRGLLIKQEAHQEMR